MVFVSFLHFFMISSLSVFSLFENDFVNRVFFSLFRGFFCAGEVSYHLIFFEKVKEEILLIIFFPSIFLFSDGWKKKGKEKRNNKKADGALFAFPLHFFGNGVGYLVRNQSKFILYFSCVPDHIFIADQRKYKKI